MEKVNLCMCNNCGSVLIDTNPQINAIDYSVLDNYNLEELEQIMDAKACPYCKTDAYLKDL